MSTNKNNKNIYLKNFSGKHWYQLADTYLSENNDYYIVPVVYKNIVSNDILKKYFINPDGNRLDVNNKLKIYSGGILEDDEFKNFTKVAAIEKVGQDLGLAISYSNKEEAKTKGIIPPDKMDFDGNLAAEAWHIDVRPPENQNLFIQVRFKKSWIDSLLPKTDTSNAAQTVILQVKTLKKDLDSLGKILHTFDKQIHKSGVIMSFDAECTAGKVSKIIEIINKILLMNDEAEISDQSPGALKFGFNNLMGLEYISYSEIPDCLCDEKNISAYILRKGFEALRRNPPFDSQVVNGLLYHLPEIMQRYSRYVRGGSKAYLFSSKESWLRFVRTYITPEPEIVINTISTSEEILANTLLTTGNAAKAVANIFKDGLQQQDPTVLLSPAVRDRVLGAANAQVQFGGDKILFDALNAELFSIESLYKNLLNKISIADLIKIAATAIIKCLPSDEVKKSLCRATLKTLSYTQIREGLYPCLMQSGDVGLAALADLETRIADRIAVVQKAASERYGTVPISPDGTSVDACNLQDITNQYCSDPYFQQKLGRAPDDFSEEASMWLEKQKEDIICNCILSVHGPAQEIIGFVEDYKDLFEDIGDIVKRNKARSIEDQNTLNLSKTFEDFYKAHRSALAAWGDGIGGVLKEAMFSIFYATVLVVLRHVMNSLLGSVMNDVCNASANPFGKMSIKNLIKNSHLYEGQDDTQLLNDLKKIATKQGFSVNVNTLLNFINDISNVTTPSELKRLLTSSCQDSSTDDIFKKVLDTVDIPFVPTISIFKDLMSALGKMIDPALLEDGVKEWEDVQAELIDLCVPQSAALDLLGQNLDPDSLAKLARKDKNELLEDINNMLYLLDPKKIENMMPPLFCGPCNPTQIGQKPLLPSQTDPSQLALVRRLNSTTYRAVDKVFNNNISSFKPIIYDIGQETVNKMHDAMKAMTAVDKNGRATEAPSAKSINKQYETEAPEIDKTIAAALRSHITTSTRGNIVLPEDIENYAVFEYEVPGIANKKILLIFNFSGETVDNFPYSGIATKNNQIKIVVATTSVPPIIEFEWPPDDLEGEDFVIKDFSLDDFVNGITEYFSAVLPSLGSALKQKPSQLPPQMKSDNRGEDSGPESVLKDIFPLASNVIFEMIFRQGTHNDLFNGVIFNEIPFTNEEMKAKCNEGFSATAQKPLLDIQKLREEVDKARKLLECVVGFLDNPDAIQISNMYGLYKLMIRICVIEEYLKNIFIFAFVKISDILKTDAYMSLLMKNLTKAVKDIIGEKGYDSLLEYSSKIINLRTQTEDPATGSEMKKILSPEECLKIIIIETAEEVNDILDARIQKVIDPNSQKKFTPYEEIASKGSASDILLARFLDYATYRDYWSPVLYPFSGPPHPSWMFPIVSKVGGQVDIPEPFVGKANGGLFFQPYVRVTSKIQPRSSGTSKVAPPRKGESPKKPPAPWRTIFWQKFKAAAAMYNKNTSQDDVAEVLGLPPKPAGSMTAPNALVPGDEVGEAIDKLIERIDAEDVAGDGLFAQFFRIFFAPVGKDGGKLDLSAENKTFKQLFSYVVSSFVVGEQSPAGSTGWDDAYYHWQDIVEGAKFEERKHWQNRGIISHSNAVAKSKLHDQYMLPIFANSNEINFTKDVWITTAISLLLKDAAADSNTSLTNVIALPGIVSEKQKAFAEKFSNRIRDIIFNSPFDLWFDFKIGMRLNLLVAVDKDQIDSIVPMLGDNRPDNYNREKTFIWFDTQKNQHYFCFPIEYEEKDININIESFASPGQGTGPEPIIDSSDKIFQEIKRYIDIDSNLATGKKIIWQAPAYGIGAPSAADEEKIADLKAQLISLKADREPWVTKFDAAKKEADVAKAAMREQMKKEILQHYPAGTGIPYLKGKPVKSYKGMSEAEALEYDLDNFTHPDVCGDPCQKGGHCKNITKIKWAANPTGISRSYRVYKIMLSPVKSDRVLQKVHAFRVKGKVQCQLFDNVKLFDESITKYALELAEEEAKRFTGDKSKLRIVYVPNYSFNEEENQVTAPTNYQSYKPTLWGMSNGISQALWYRKDYIFTELKLGIGKKIFGTDGGTKNILLNELIPIKELTVVAALMYRYYMEGTYPSLNTLLDPTKATLNSIIAKALAIIEGDTEYTDPSIENLDSLPNFKNMAPSPAEIVKQFLMLILQTASNVSDPTWKTPWLFPGPVTPVGVITKLLSMNFTKDESGDDKKDLFGIKEEECLAAPPPEEENEE